MRTIAELQDLNHLRKLLGTAEMPRFAFRESERFGPLRKYVEDNCKELRDEDSFIELYNWLYDAIQREMIESFVRGNWIPVEIALPRADADDEYAGSFPRSKTVLVILEGEVTPVWGYYNIMAGDWVLVSKIHRVTTKVVAWQEIAPYTPH